MNETATASSGLRSGILSLVMLMRGPFSLRRILRSCHCKEAFPGRVHELDGKDYASMVDSVADMYLLGRCGRLVLSPTSSFSECAWWWGGARAAVRMLPQEYNQGDV